MEIFFTALMLCRTWDWAELNALFFFFLDMSDLVVSSLEHAL